MPGHSRARIQTQAGECKGWAAFSMPCFLLGICDFCHSIIESAEWNLLFAGLTPSDPQWMLSVTCWEWWWRYTHAPHPHPTGIREADHRESWAPFSQAWLSTLSHFSDCGDGCQTSKAVVHCLFSLQPMRKRLSPRTKTFPDSVTCSALSMGLN